MAGRAKKKTGSPRRQLSEPSDGSFYGSATRKVFALFVVVACMSAIVPVIPQWQELKKIEASLAETQEVERQMKADSERYQAEKKALKENQFYLESRARDRLHRYLPEENVVRMEE